LLGTILRYYPTYSETFVYRELAELRRQGLPIHVLTMRHRRLQRWAPQCDLAGPLAILPRRPIYLPILRGAIRQYRRDPAAARAALRWGRQHLRLKDCLKALWMADHFQAQGVSLLHVHFAGEGAELAEIIRRCTGIPYGITLHARDLFVPRSSLPDLLAHARYLICIPRFNRDWLAQRFPAEIPAKARVIPLGVTLPATPMSQAPRAQHRPFSILSVSRLVPKKGQVDLIRAVHKLIERGAAVHLTIAGEGPLRKPLEALVRRLGLEASISLPGALTEAQLEARYRSDVDAFVLPAVVASDGDRDGIPVALMEAMVRGIPVVSCPVSGIPELITHRRDGLLVPSERPQALADALESLRLNPALCHQLGRQARQTIASSFELSANVHRLLGFLREQQGRATQKMPSPQIPPGL